MKTPRIRVLQPLPECHDRSNDPEDLAEQIVSAFPRDSFEVTSAYFQGVPTKGQPTSQAEHTHHFDFPDSSLKGLRLSLKRTLYDYCEKHSFDVVICHRYKPVSTMLSINRRLKIPVCIGISHGFGEYKTLWRKIFAKASISSAWRFVGVSPAVRDHLISQNCGFTSKNTVAITNAFDVSATEARQLSREAARQELGLPESARIVGAIGRLVPVKGHIFLIQAFASIASRFPDTHLAIIGAGREEANLKAEISRCGLDSRIHLLGWKTRAKQYVRAFDIWTMPSLKEGFGLALLEGMCGHLPIIASDLPAMRPMVEGAQGVCVPAANAAALATSIGQYLSLSDETLASIGEKAYQYVRAHHGVEEYRSAYLALVTNALRENCKPETTSRTGGDE